MLENYLVVTDPESRGSGLTIPLAEFEFSYARSSGPGGQNVNKVNSKALLRWNALDSPSLPIGVRDRFKAAYGSRLNAEGELTLSGDRFRDQRRNAQDCLDRLTEMLQTVLHPPRPRRPTKPTRGSKRRRVDSKKIRAGHKQNRRRVE